MHYQRQDNTLYIFWPLQVVSYRIETGCDGEYIAFNDAADLEEFALDFQHTFCADEDEPLAVFPFGDTWDDTAVRINDLLCRMDAAPALARCA